MTLWDGEGSRLRYGGRSGLDETQKIRIDDEHPQGA
jgi:hypothetical protein